MKETISYIATKRPNFGAFAYPEQTQMTDAGFHALARIVQEDDAIYLEPVEKENGQFKEDAWFEENGTYYNMPIYNLENAVDVQKLQELGLHNVIPLQQ